MSASERRARRGVLAEQHVADFVADRGWTIVQRNFRTRTGEVDMVAWDGDVLVFIEVRARTGVEFGLADDTVDRRKLTKITRTAMEFIQEYPQYAESWWRIDLFAITLNRAGDVVACRQYENLTLD